MITSKNKPYDPDSKCYKCGFDDIVVIYCEGDYPCNISCEHLDRICKRCGYKWIEKCLKKEKA